MEHPVNPFEKVTTFEEGIDMLIGLMDLQAMKEAKMVEASAQVAELAPEPAVAAIAEVHAITSAPSVRKAETQPEMSPRRRALASIAASVAVLGVALGIGTGRTEPAAASPQEAAMEQAGFLPSDGTLSESYDNPTTTKIETIADREIVFFAEQARPGSHHFGPEGESSSPDDALKNMLARSMVDPSLLVGNMEMAGITDAKTPEQRDALVRHYIDDRDAFDAAQKQYADFLTQDGAKISFSTFEGKKVDYYTMYMVPNTEAGQPPMIYQLKTSMQGKLVLRIDAPGIKGGEGRTIYNKIDCGYQPMSPKPFENVPELPPHLVPPIETTTTTSTIPETTTSTTSTTAPETTTTSTTVPETTTTTSTTIPETTTTTSTIPETTTTTTSTIPETTTTTSIPPKEDDGEVPGEHNEPGEPDNPGEGPAEQEPGEDGYLPGEVPVTPPTAPPETVPTSTTTTTQVPATTSPAPSSTNPPVTVTTVVTTTVPEDQMPQMP